MDKMHRCIYRACMTFWFLICDLLQPCGSSAVCRYIYSRGQGHP